MKFLVDAQLPRRLARWLQASGHDAIHTRDLPEGNRMVQVIYTCAFSENDHEHLITPTQKLFTLPLQ